MSAEETVLLTYDGPVAVVTMNRPDRHNAFTDAMDTRFFDVLAELHERPDVRCVVWRGEGKSFSSGRDTKELGVRTKGESDLEYIEQAHAKTALLWTMPVPIVVALKGWVLGGSFERALLCDMRIAADDARMGLPETGHGVMPDSGGAARIFQMAGHGLAADLALTGRIIDASEALRHGLVSRVFPAGELDDAVMAVAQEIAKRSPLAIKFAVNVIRGLGIDAVRRVMNEEKLGQTAIFASEDYQEFKAARAENREPKFRGR
ncbi:MAG TPA: enoyl-CoA hydratase/isomerase family protein [Actinomycetota bacterium]|nr:enoyl-CoA hydratase/isomerase family protein [Actinomycetota bacterium]